LSGGGPLHPVVVDPAASGFFSVPKDVRLVEPAEGSPGVTHPRGFLAAGVAAGIKESGRPDVGVVAVAADYRADAVGAAVFTRNSFAAAPVIVSRKGNLLETLTAVVMNSGSANACTGAAGLVAARAMQTATAAALGVAPDRVGVASTGPIGRLLDTSAVVRGIDAAVADLSSDGGSRFSEAILTTDRFAKMCAVDVHTRDGVVRVGATAKGAGMISPGMATMLCLVTTDAMLTPTVARSLLSREVNRTFNRISVDGQMSTNDCVFLMANGASGIALSGEALAQFGAGLRTVLLRLALMMVADGEGATKVARLRVKGARTDEEARIATRAVADSTLVKTAFYGCDPNWGRILSAVGAALPDSSFPRVTLDIGGTRIVQGAEPVELDPDQREAIHATMRGCEIDVVLDLAAGGGTDEVYFSDLGHEYVTINADYHT
jgi:glutamate N-acetyltransferase/amino-acid N-acetyltransferase